MVKIFSLLFSFSFFAEGVSRIRLKGSSFGSHLRWRFLPISPLVASHSGSGASLIMDQGAASQLEVTTMLFATINASFASMDTRLAALEGSKKNLFVVLFTRFINRLKGASSPPLRLSAETTAGTTAGAVELSALFDLPGPVHHFLFKASVSNAYNGRTDWMLLVNGVEVDRSEYENT